MPDDENPSPFRTQRSGRVVATLDGDAHLHVWEPNRPEGHIDCDLTEHLALLIDLGLDAPPAPEPHWADSGGTTVIVSLEAGARGHVAVSGHPISTEAGVRLAANGFLQLLRNAVASPPADLLDLGDDDTATTPEG